MKLTSAITSTPGCASAKPFNLDYYWPAERALRRYLEIHDDLNADIKPLPYVLEHDPYHPTNPGEALQRLGTEAGVV